MTELHPVRRRWLRKANLPVKHTDTRLADLKPFDGADNIEAVENFLDALVDGSHGGVGLALIGKPGLGKTTLSCAILNEIIHRAPGTALGHLPEVGFSMQRPVVFIEYATYLTTKQQLQKLASQGLMDTEDFNKADVLCEGIEAICLNDAWNARVLVLDDVGKEYTTTSGWAENTLDEVLRHRFNRGFPTIITSNNYLEKWGKLYNDSMKSFAKEAFVEVGLGGIDRRGRRG